MTDRIQDVYPLAPGQGGILLESARGAGDGRYVMQILLDLRGAVDPLREAAAWRALVDRHDALRTALVWEGQPRPLQVVGRTARPELGVTDLADRSEAERSAALAAILEEDRRRGFALTRAPLLRVHRFDLGGGRHRAVVTFHHVALDGWSIPILLRDWIALYAGRALPPALPFRDHVAGMLSQDRAAALAFWARELAGLPLAFPAAAAAGPGGAAVLRLSPEDSARVEAQARRARLTLGTVTHGLWGLLVARHAGARDSLYGLARAGRPAALPGAEGRVGMFLNTLPVRARLDEDRPLAAWLAGLQTQVQGQAPHAHVGLGEALAAAGRPRLDSVAVFENYPTDPALLGAAPGFVVEAVEVRERTSFPLALFAAARPDLELRLLHDGGLDAAGAGRLLDDLQALLLGFAARPEASLSAFRPMGPHPGSVLRRSAPGRSAAAPAPVGPAPVDPAAAAAILPRLGRIWQELLESGPPARDDNFFDLGGHSLLVIALQERIRRDLGAAAEMPDLFRFATLAAQAGHVAALLTPAPAPDAAAERGPGRAGGAARLRRRRLQTLNEEPADHV